MNLNLLWQSLDSLPNGEQDLLGPALDQALSKLTALPDPEAQINTGVQLMTIHKSKGLEFEVVIVPELQARSRLGQSRMLSWLERGLLPDEITEDFEGSDQVTEFLVAPLQFKGADRSKPRMWVDRVYREREEHEMRRILYVAATRAREELHIFARPAYKRERDGSWSLADPSASLLKTAWPAFEEQIRTQFEEWKTSQVEPAESSKSSSLSLRPLKATCFSCRRHQTQLSPRVCAACRQITVPTKHRLQSRRDRSNNSLSTHPQIFMSATKAVWCRARSVPPSMLSFSNSPAYARPTNGPRRALRSNSSSCAFTARIRAIAAH